MCSCLSGAPRVSVPGTRSVLRLPRLADPALAAALRSLRLARSMAGAALCGVQRAAHRVRERAGGDRVRRAVRGGSSHAWKERGQRRLALQAASSWSRRLPGRRLASLAFVPVRRERALERGHRPADALARELGQRWELPVEPLLRRSRSRRAAAAGLGLPSGAATSRGAFAPARASPSRVCLVDDVYTSGATAAAAASALRRGGARQVEVVTLARAVR